jgi:ribonuclease HI
MKEDLLIIYTDGGARGNPGPAACAAVIKNKLGKTINQLSKYLGETTNNQAEYQGVFLGLNQAKELKAKEIIFYLDSELVVNQLCRKFKVKDLGLQSLFVKVWNLSSHFSKISYHHIPREQNQEADSLVNQQLDKVLKNKLTNRG